MTYSLLHTVPHLPVPIDTDQRNPLPAHHVPTSLKMSPVALKTQQVAVFSTGIAPVPLKSIHTRPIEVQPLEKVSFPGGVHRLPFFNVAHHARSEHGRWDHDFRTARLKERVALPMQRVPMMSVPPLRVATEPVRTHTTVIRRNKRSHRLKKSSSARIW